MGNVDMQATSLLYDSLEYDLVYPLLTFEQAPDLILQVWLVDGLHRGDREAILVGAGLPAQDEAWHQGVGAAAGATAGGVEGGVTHKVQDLAPAKGKLSLLHQKVMPADSGDLLIQFLMDVFVRQLLPTNQGRFMPTPGAGYARRPGPESLRRWAGSARPRQSVGYDGNAYRPRFHSQG